MVGPFNEHLLTPGSLQRYQQVKAAIGAWLEERKIPHVIPAPLPSEQYGDASHPLAEGYRALARTAREGSILPVCRAKNGRPELSQRRDAIDSQPDSKRPSVRFTAIAKRMEAWS